VYQLLFAQEAAEVPEKSEYGRPAFLTPPDCFRIDADGGRLSDPFELFLNLRTNNRR